MVREIFAARGTWIRHLMSLGEDSEFTGPHYATRGSPECGIIGYVTAAPFEIAEPLTEEVTETDKPWACIVGTTR